MEVNIQDDLNAVNDNISKLVDELNKVNAARENLLGQIQNLNGVAMYLRGKLPPEEQQEIAQAESSETETSEGDPNINSEFERKAEYPES